MDSFSVDGLLARSGDITGGRRWGGGALNRPEVGQRVRQRDEGYRSTKGQYSPYGKAKEIRTLRGAQDVQRRVGVAYHQY